MSQVQFFQFFHRLFFRKFSSPTVQYGFCVKGPLTFSHHHLFLSLRSPAALSLAQTSILCVTKVFSHFWFLMALSVVSINGLLRHPPSPPAIWCMLRARSPGGGSRSRSSPWGGGPGRSRARGRAWTRTRTRTRARATGGGAWGGRYVACSPFSCWTSSKTYPARQVPVLSL